LAVLEVGWEGIWPIYTGLQRVSGGSKKKKKRRRRKKKTNKILNAKRE
jgi:hypothetical protein